nr:hypothetical protein [Tanacetum cinerariifolium]
MRTRSSSTNLSDKSSPNLTYSNLKRRNRRRSNQPFILEESPVDTMADQRTMGESLRAPTEGYAEEQPVVGSKKNPRVLFSLGKILFPDSSMNYFLPQERQISVMKFLTFNNEAVEKICVTCGGAHLYYQCLAADGNTFPEFRDNIKGYISAAAVN